MAAISRERKESILSRILPPNNERISDVLREEGVSKSAVYRWLADARKEGLVVSSSRNNTNWSSEKKFMAVVATSGMNAEELAAYCREHGLYPEEINSWKSACVSANSKANKQDKQQKKDSKSDKQRIKQLEKELKRKEKALAETAALLVLRKKLNAYYQGDEDV